MPQPTQITYIESFEPFTTDQYMTPEDESWSLGQLEQFQVDNLIHDELKLAESMLRFPQSITPSNQHFWFTEFFPRICYEWCYWFDRQVTSEEVDHRLLRLIDNILRQFHYEIINEETHERYSIPSLLQSIRSVRDRMFPDTMGHPWNDEWP